MYCKNCGQKIADDSKFCQFCGIRQDEMTSPSSTNLQSSLLDGKQRKVIEIPAIKANLSDSTQWWILGCSIWFVVNLVFLFADGWSGSASRHFFPFYYFDLEYYDITEFIVYVLGLPLIVWLFVMLKKSLMKKSHKATSKKMMAMMIKIT